MDLDYSVHSEFIAECLTDILKKVKKTQYRVKKCVQDGQMKIRLEVSSAPMEVIDLGFIESNCFTLKIVKEDTVLVDTFFNPPKTAIRKVLLEYYAYFSEQADEAVLKRLRHYLNAE